METQFVPSLLDCNYKVHVINEWRKLSRSCAGDRRTTGWGGGWLCDEYNRVSTEDDDDCRAWLASGLNANGIRFKLCKTNFEAGFLRLSSESLPKRPFTTLCIVAMNAKWNSPPGLPFDSYFARNPFIISINFNHNFCSIIIFSSLRPFLL